MQAIFGDDIGDVRNFKPSSSRMDTKHGCANNNTPWWQSTKWRLAADFSIGRQHFSALDPKVHNVLYAILVEIEQENSDFSGYVVLANWQIPVKG